MHDMTTPIPAPPVLRTARLVLRPMAGTDNHALLAVMADPEAMRYFSSAPWSTLAQADASIDNTLADYASGAALRLAITLDGSNELLGTCTLYAFHRTNRRCEIGYILGRPHWGKGYMGEALIALLDYGFTQLALHRIEADIDPRNLASGKLLVRLAFRPEGYMRERWIVNGEVSDSALFGLLRSDWQARAE